MSDVFHLVDDNQYKLLLDLTQDIAHKCLLVRSIVNEKRSRDLHVFSGDVIAIVDFKEERKIMDDLDFEMVRQVLMKGPFEELRKTIGKIRELLYNVQWDPNFSCGYLNFSDGSSLSGLFQQMFDRPNSELCFAVSKFITLCINKFVIETNPRLSQVPVGALQNYYVYLAKAIHRVLVFCDISESWAREPLNIRYPKNDADESAVETVLITVPTTETIHQKLLQIQATTTFYPRKKARV